MKPNDESGGLYLFDLQTGRERYLTLGQNVDPTYGLFFAWSTKHRRLLYASGMLPQNIEISAVDLLGNSTQLTNSNSLNYAPEWFPNGQGILFISVPGNDVLNAESYSMDSNGSDSRKTVNYQDWFCSHMQWSPDMTKLAGICRSKDNQRRSLLLIDAISGKLLYSNSEHEHINVDWSSDGKKLIYTGSLDSEASKQYYFPMYKKLYVFDVTQKKETAIVDAKWIINRPIWSPVDNRIVFTAGTPLSHNIFIIDDDGQNKKPLTDANFYTIADWSPDGKNLLLQSFNESSLSEIYVLDVSNKKIKKVISNDNMNINPVWVDILGSEKP